MHLVINIGNSRINAALFDGSKIEKTYSFVSRFDNNPKFYESEFKKNFGNENITDCAIISVVNSADIFIKDVCDSAFGVDSVILNYKFAKDIKINTKQPECVGMDRLANVVAVSDLPLPAIVVDIGTAITFDVINEKKVFLGGVIMPGVNMGLRALADGTSKLPEIKAQNSPAAIGTTTETCILSGVIRGTAAAIDGLLKQSADELGSCKTIILTGGQAELVSKYMEYRFDKIDKDLTLIGVKKMYDSCC